MQHPELILVGAPDEGDVKSDGQQEAFAKFLVDAENKDALKPYQIIQKSEGTQAFLAGYFAIDFIATTALPLASAIAIYLRAKRGRRVKIKVDGIEIIADTPAQVGEMLEQARKHSESSTE